jgi:glycosyltransferase involved in cell wall biosynthesis
LTKEITAGKMMIRVGLITTEFIQGWGGIASYCINLCRSLGDEVEFHVISTSPKNKGQKQSQSDILLPKNVKFEAIYSGGNSPLSNLSFQFALVRELPGLIKKNKLDLVHSAGPLADNLLRIKGTTQIPHILTYHSTLSGQRKAISLSGVKFKDLHRSEQITLLLYPFMQLYESISLSRTKNVIAVSKAVEKELRDDYKYKGKITVIHNGIDIDMFSPGELKADKKRIIYCGRLIALKGPQILIKAIPQVLKEHKDVIFTFVGAGNKEYYRDLLLTAGVSETNFEFIKLNYPQMPDLYRSGTLMVLPSLTESFPMSILEAMACGIPVVASDVGDVADMVKNGETGFLTTKGDFTALSEKINILLNDESSRKRMGQSARNLVEANFSLKCMGEQTLQIYRKALDR